jgi:hypothetical protein
VSFEADHQNALDAGFMPASECPRFEIPAKCLPIALAPLRFNVLKGGRGSAKSRTVARLLVLSALSPRIIDGHEMPFRCLCTREVQKSMKDSVHRLIADEIRRMGLGEFFDILETEIRGPNGALFLFAGLLGHTIETLKSYEGLTDVWVEEASSVAEHSWEILIPTVRAKGSRFYITFNPDSAEDAVWKRFVVNPPPADRCQVIDLNFEDNPWFEDTELVEESAELKRTNPVLWQHVYGGQLRSKNGLIFKRNWLRWYDPDDPNDCPADMLNYGAADYAVTPEGGDWTEMGIFGMDYRGRLYVRDWYFDQADPHDWVDAAGAPRKGWIDAWLDLVEKWGPVYWFEEKGPILSSVGGAMNQAMMARHMAGRPAWVTRMALASVGSKASRAAGINTRKPTLADQARAMGFAGRMSAGAVYFPRPSPDRPWVHRLIEQLMAFHGLGSQVDDGVDVCSVLARGLDSMARGEAPKAEKPPPLVPHTDAWFKARDAMHAPDQREKENFYGSKQV